MKILITGSSGLLGTEILKLDKSLIAPSETAMDVTDLSVVLATFGKVKPDCVLHLAAATKPPEHNEHPEKGIKTNIIGTANMAIACKEQSIRLVYTCTDYNYIGKGPHNEDEPQLPPYNFGWSKLGGESAVRMIPNSLVLRLSFGPYPYPWEKVYQNQWNSKLYVDEMAPLVLQSVKSEAVGVLNLGGPCTSLENYAKRSRPDIGMIPRPDWVPQDTSLDITKMKKLFNIQDAKSLYKR